MLFVRYDIKLFLIWYLTMAFQVESFFITNIVVIYCQWKYICMERNTFIAIEGLVLYLIWWESSWQLVRVKCCYSLRGRRGLAGRLYSYWIPIKDDEATTGTSRSALEWLVTIQSALMRSAKCDGQLSPPWASPHQPQLNCHGRHKVVCQPFNF